MFQFKLKNIVLIITKQNWKNLFRFQQLLTKGIIHLFRSNDSSVITLTGWIISLQSSLGVTAKIRTKLSCETTWPPDAPSWWEHSRNFIEIDQMRSRWRCLDCRSRICYRLPSLTQILDKCHMNSFMEKCVEPCQ